MKIHLVLALVLVVATCFNFLKKQKEQDKIESSKKDVIMNNFFQKQKEENLYNDEQQINKNIQSNKYMNFDEWAQLFAKKYSSQEERMYRKYVFLHNLIDVKIHNLQFEQGKTTFLKGLNHLSDLTSAEFLQRYTWKTNINPLFVTNQCKGSIMDTPSPPAEKDWANKVNELGEQGTCGKDWAMVAVASVQSLYSLKVGQLPILSVQQMLECSGDYGNQGCYGGFMDQAFWYIIDYGIATEKSYPIRSVSTCKYVLNMRFTGIGSCARVPMGNYSKLMSAIVQQPVSIALNLSPDMAGYSSGVYNGQCTTQLNHGMLLTGYGGKQPSHYWRLRNTLGSSWGMKGYIHILREQKDGPGKCGIQTWASVPQSIN